MFYKKEETEQAVDDRRQSQDDDIPEVDIDEDDG